MILNLTLKKKWFDMIKSGQKKEEYREFKNYWGQRLFLKENKLGYRNFTHVLFRNGYAKDSPSFLIECKGIRIGFGREEWGAPKNKDVFIISLGEIAKQLKR